MDFSELLQKIEEVPRGQLLGCFFLLYLIIAGGGYTFVYSPQIDSIEKTTKELKVVRGKLIQSRGVERELQAFKLELVKLKLDLKMASNMLPREDEIPSLLKQISDLGTQSGLDFLLFKPQPEKKLGFYAEVPVELAFAGGFNNVCMFFDAVSRLPRLVNITDISINAPKEKNGYVLVDTKCTATTFRYINKPEENVSKDKNKKNN